MLIFILLLEYWQFFQILLLELWVHCICLCNVQYYISLLIFCRRKRHGDDSDFPHFTLLEPRQHYVNPLPHKPLKGDISAPLWMDQVMGQEKIKDEDIFTEILLFHLFLPLLLSLWHHWVYNQDESKKTSRDEPDPDMNLISIHPVALGNASLPRYLWRCSCI